MKNVEVEGNVFYIEKIKAIPSLCLLRELLSLVIDTRTVKGVALQTMVRNMYEMNELTEEQKNQMHELAQFDNIDLFSFIVDNIFTKLDDESLERVIHKCVAYVTMKNGIVNVKGDELVDIVSVVTLLQLVKEVIIYNFKEELPKLKKLIQETVTK